MRLNNTSYVHKKIRILCFLLENSTGLKLVTDLSENFEQLKFMSALSYLVIDWKKQAYFTMSHHLSKEEEQEVQDLLLYLDWLDLGHKIQEKNIKYNIKVSKKNHVRKGK